MTRQRAHSDWAEVEVFVDCKLDDSCDPYDDGICNGVSCSGTDDDCLRRFTAGASTVFEYQHRTHHFSVVLLGSWARLARWDRSGVIFSSKFDYKQEPAKLARFFWRVARASAEVRGHDTTATRVLPGSDNYELLKAWKAKEKTLADDDYVAKRFVKSLSDVGEFMYNFFDDGLPVGENEYTCGVLKQQVLNRGELISLRNKIIWFLRHPPSRSAGHSGSAALVAVLPQDQTEASTTSTMFETTSTTVESPPEENLHPIHDVIFTLLEWFSARYKLRAPIRTIGKSFTQPIVPPTSGPAARRWNRTIRKTQPTVSHPTQGKDRQKLEALAEKIRSHRDMLELLVLAGAAPNWPDADRLPDQLSSTYDPHKPKKFREKRSRAEGDVDEQPSSKRQRSTASQT
ncbi:hypothetical protein BN946_scf184924.g2 [Trametes cinnabarina]|uniref:Fungal-type protein kinase domain-containing protein n=1 Tax=Pycnoporus cinnabarinus TaxID=5643 RepID=A0A060SIU9_PYCCI|nr:hypothetical protein BN946_scf184924.g2 [Trametes cinnabarina]